MHPRTLRPTLSLLRENCHVNPVHNLNTQSDFVNTQWATYRHEGGSVRLQSRSSSAQIEPAADKLSVTKLEKCGFREITSDVSEISPLAVDSPVAQLLLAEANRTALLTGVILVTTAPPAGSQ